MTNAIQVPLAQGRGQRLSLLPAPPPGRVHTAPMGASDQWTVRELDPWASRWDRTSLLIPVDALPITLEQP